MHEVAVSQDVLLALAGKAAEPAVETVVLLVDRLLLHTRVNHLLFSVHLDIQFSISVNIKAFNLNIKL